MHVDTIGRHRPRLVACLFVATVLALYPPEASAGTNFLGALHFDVGVPQGDLDDQLDRNGYGIGGQIFFAPSVSPLAIGLDLAWMNVGRETRREAFSTTIPDVTVDVERMNNIVQAFVVLRAQMPEGPVRLYGDGLIGFNYLFTETSIKDTDDAVGNIASTTNREDTAFAYGVGGGVMVPVHTRTEPVGGGAHPFQVLLDAGARYLRGDKAEYLKEGSVRISNGNVTFDSVESRTDIVRAHVGVAVRF